MNLNRIIYFQEDLKQDIDNYLILKCHVYDLQKLKNDFISFINNLKNKCNKTIKI